MCLVMRYARALRSLSKFVLHLLIEVPCFAFVPLKRDRESSKCKEVIPLYCCSLASPVRLRRTTGDEFALLNVPKEPYATGRAVAFSHWAGI
jgi:hypothetical protein